MANRLSDKDKKEDAAAQAAAAPSLPVTNANGIGAYGKNHALASGTYRKEWESSAGAPWADDRKKRMAIRVFSRGVMGAAFFTAGGLLAKKWMTPGTNINGAVRHGYDAAKGWSEQLPFTKEGNPLKFLAKLIDTTVGRPLAWTFGENAARFRPTMYSGRSYDGTKTLLGRTLGDETVMITFDFFCASVGDAWGRDIAGWFDPNVKKDWLVTDEKGHSHIKFPEALKSTLHSLTRYVTYNGGEDWFVSIPYAYFMKGQRAILNKFSPGFAYDFDQQLNGSGFKTGLNPKTGRHEITGNYNKWGMLDLQNRFTVYNIGTLMFRELHDHISHLITRGKDHIYGAHDLPPNRSLMAKAGDYVKWMMRSAVKGVIVMTPAVPFFWITRTPQTAHRGIFIDPEHGVITHTLNSGKRWPIYANDLRDGNISANERIYHSRLNEDTGRWSVTPLSGHSIEPVRQARRFDPYAQAGRGNNIGMVVEGIGRMNYGASGSLDWLAKRADDHLPGGTRIKSFLDIKNFERFTRPAVYASLSYTPYMIAKAETALLWDNGKMDMATERMVDGITGLNWGEFTAGAGEVWRTFLRKPLSDPKREAEGQWRLYLDRAPVDVFSKTAAQMEREKRQFHQQRWQNLVTGSRPAEKSPLPAAGGDGASLENTYKVARRGAYAETAPHPSDSHAEQEDLKKLLREAEPPTSSVH